MYGSDAAPDMWVVNEPVIGYARALNLRGQDARTHLERAYAHLFNGDYDSAETEYCIARCLNPPDDVKESLAKIGRVLCTMR